MNNENPYQAPAANFSQDAVVAGQLASRGARFLASMIDGILQLVLAVPMMFALGLLTSLTNPVELSVAQNLLASVLGFAIFVLINGYLLKTRGQTVGKRLLNICIVDMAGNQPSLQHILIKRQLPVVAVTLIPGIGPVLPFIDVLFVFRRDRRCIHDLIAGTKVVVA